jgi:hypothetical protein
MSEFGWQSPRSGLGDAPQDGNFYLRQNGAWVAAGTMALQNANAIAVTGGTETGTTLYPVKLWAENNGGVSIALRVMDAPPDQKHFDTFAASSAIQLRMINDAISASNTYMTASRGSGITITNVSVVATTGGVILAQGATAWAAVSDERTKVLGGPIADATERLLEMRTVMGRYDYEDPDTAHPFLIAQDAERLFPEAVSTVDRPVALAELDPETGAPLEEAEPEKVLALTYTDFIPVLVAAVKELSARIAMLEDDFS